MRRATRLLVVVAIVAALSIALLSTSFACYVGVNGIGVQVC